MEHQVPIPMTASAELTPYTQCASPATPTTPKAGKGRTMDERRSPAPCPAFVPTCRGYGAVDWVEGYWDRV